MRVEKGNLSLNLSALRLAMILGLHELLNPLGNSPFGETICPPIARP